MRALLTGSQVVRMMTSPRTGAARVLTYPVSSPLPTPRLRVHIRLLFGALP